MPNAHGPAHLKKIFAHTSGTQNFFPMPSPCPAHGQSPRPYPLPINKIFELIRIVFVILSAPQDSLDTLPKIDEKALQILMTKQNCEEKNLIYSSLRINLEILRRMRVPTFFVNAHSAPSFFSKNLLAHKI